MTAPHSSSLDVPRPLTFTDLTAAAGALTTTARAWINGGSLAQIAASPSAQPVAPSHESSNPEPLSPIAAVEETNPPPSWPAESVEAGLHATPDTVSPPPSRMTPAASVDNHQPKPANIAVPTSSAAPTDSPPVAVDQDRGDDYKAPAPQLTSTARQAWVFSKPSRKARKIGYLRAGAVVARAEDPAGRRGCKRGWYHIEPQGYVCVGRAAALRGDGPVALAASVRAHRADGLPYIYGMSKYPPPPLYVRLPSEAEQRKAEENAGKRRIKAKKTGFEDAVGPMPEPLLYGHGMPSLDRKSWGNTLVGGTPAVRSGFGILQVFSWTDRLFGVTTDLKLVPMDRLRRVVGSSMQGIHLPPGSSMPVAFVRSRVARKYEIDQMTKAIKDAGPVAFREGFALTGQRSRLGGHVYLQTRAGVYIRQSERVVIVPPIKNVPGWAKRGRKWVDVSILRQTLVAYEGTTPVFATLVSTGVDGLGDPEKTHSTIRGVFLIHTKHVSVTMDNDEEGDVYDLRDVPYVQYFMDGYALHAAYWHDDFGTPHSHGCINLAPKDAAWLFQWTDPKVPVGWHGRLQLRGGTIVYTHA